MSPARDGAAAPLENSLGLVKSVELETVRHAQGAALNPQDQVCGISGMSAPDVLKTTMAASPAPPPVQAKGGGYPGRDEAAPSSSQPIRAKRDLDTACWQTSLQAS